MYKEPQAALAQKEEVEGEAAEMDGKGPQLSQDALWTFSGVGCGALEGLS